MIRIGIDIGGTFTDFAVWNDRGGHAHLLTFKVPSTPPHFDEAFKTGVERILETIAPEPGETVIVVHGTTVSTNQVIERSGPPIALLVTAGFKDVLEVQRLRLRNALNMLETRIKPLVERNFVKEIKERTLHDGSILLPIDEADVLAAAGEAIAAGATGIAIAFHHSFRNDSHEKRAREMIRARFPAMDVTISSEIWPRMGEYERATVAVLNAYVKERMDAYLTSIDRYLSARLDGQRLFIMRSNGGAMSAQEAAAFPVHTLLSGPASGVTAAQFVGRSVSDEKLLTLDMGGTSTDVSLIQNDRPTVSNNAEVGDFPLIMPVTGIEAIGAGGGSIAWLDSGVLRMGPRSAGAYPGPACFGRGGTQPTLTDAYLICNYLDPESFLGGRMKLDRSAAEAAMRPLAAALRLGVTQAAEACITVATSNMVAGVLPYLARYGVDPEDATLVLFGGGGALHGPLLAEEIGVKRILIPSLPSVFCAFGGLVSNLVHDTITSVRGVPVVRDTLVDLYDKLVGEAEAWLSAQTSPDQISGTLFEYWAEMAYEGQSFQIDVMLDEKDVRAGDLANVRRAFHAEHDRLYGHSEPEASVQFTELRVRIRGVLAMPQHDFRPPPRQNAAPPSGAGRMRHVDWGDGQAGPTRIRNYADLDPGEEVQGPAIIEQSDTTIVVPSSFTARMRESGVIVMSVKG
ncbi:hydantoinase/oxoprolinase family protein [Bosea sp. (in: a-proteobacteria)]|uniref:hydantoinase/oxoprolinase family protein n=1 Tax=Bosea sp. (in: a-proteobacteria) TaxID=1871050 RepID=UPI0026335BD9|nr:hydantoinase/oxoprolinase family protein [Bosea sp. (in: a-proteobacteria)]MCO5093493.1 hydantoinase/oxoprolinase family protein [Bosea sp. (in: a-proteobacteria)]